MKLPVWKKVVITFFIMVASSAAGLWLGSLVLPDAHSAASGIKWSSLGSPPEAAVKIAGEFLCDRTYGVVVQAASGARYLSCSSGWKPWEEKFGKPWSLSPCRGNPPTQYCPAFERLPKPVRACGMKYTNEWTIIETVYTVLDDGSVWHWNFTYGIGTVLSYWLGGLMAGLVVGIFISIGVWWQSPQRKPAAAP
jgi:hypothetical protein